MVSVLLGWLLGIAQGLRHAFEPDHLAAVSTMVAEQKSARASVSYATAWGAGHALVLTVVGGLLFFLRTEMPVRLGNVFELLVGLMLVVLGARALRQAIREGKKAGLHVPLHTHAGGAIVHEHAGAAEHVHLSRFTFARRPLFVGVVHGLAGSGALTALVLPKLSSMMHGVVFMALYGFGAMLGMAVLAGLLGAPLARLARTKRGLPTLLAVSGGLSLVLGVVWGSSAFLRVLA
ncbi:MAG: hypothetical protein U0174_03940 [Polyangiaceae bacterium]